MKALAACLAAAVLAVALSATAGAASTATHFNGVEILISIPDRGTTWTSDEHVGHLRGLIVRYVFATNVEWLHGVRTITGNYNLSSPGTGSLWGTFDLDVDNV